MIVSRSNVSFQVPLTTIGVLNLLKKDETILRDHPCGLYTF